MNTEKEDFLGFLNMLQMIEQVQSTAVRKH